MLPKKTHTHTTNAITKAITQVEENSEGNHAPSFFGFAWLFF